MSARFEELDSLRGLAAVLVVNTHILLSFPVFYDPAPAGGEPLFVRLLKDTPLHLLWAGHASVIFFFLLSGFVLALPFLEGKQAPYLSYLVKRACRIYAPYLAAFGLAMLGYLALGRTAEVSALSSWYNSLWQTKPNAELLLHHLFLLGNFDTEPYLYTIWSLVHEMRISILFPLLMFVVIHFAYRVNLLLSLAIFAATPALNFAISHLFHLRPEQFYTYVETFHYSAVFLLGALIAKFRTTLLAFVQGLSVPVKIAAAAAGVLAFTYDSWFFRDIALLHARLFDDLSMTIGSIAFLLLGLGSRAFSAFLRVRPVHYIGKISYSLYLFHPIALLVSVKLMYGQLPLWSIFLLAFVLSMAGAAVLYRLVEVPSVRLGRKLASAVGARRRHPVRKSVTIE